MTVLTVPMMALVEGEGVDIFLVEGVVVVRMVVVLTVELVEELQLL